MSIYDEQKIDCHNHIFDPVRFPYLDHTPYRPAGQEIGTARQFLETLDAYGVGHALLVEPTSGYRADNRCMLDALKLGAGRFKGVAVVADETGIEELQALKAQGVVGIAFNPAGEGVDVMKNTAPLFERLAALEMFVQVQVYEAQLLELLPLLDGYRGQLLIDHCGRPTASEGVQQAAFQALLRLAGSGRTTVKISGMQKFCDRSRLFEECQPYVDALLKAFGPEHCIWGSDWPFLRATERVDYGVLLKLAERLIPDADTRHQVMWVTPMRLFGFGQ